MYARLFTSVTTNAVSGSDVGYAGTNLLLQAGVHPALAERLCNEQTAFLGGIVLAFGWWVTAGSGLVQKLPAGDLTKDFKAPVNETIRPLRT